MARSKRSSDREAFWRLLVEEQRGCGLTIRTFCQQKGISEPSFYAWRRELQQRDNEKAKADDNCRLIPVDVVDATRDNGGRHAADQNGQEQTRPLEIVMPGGFTLRFDPQTPPETVGRLLTVIARCPGEGAASC